MHIPTHTHRVNPHTHLPFLQNEEMNFMIICTTCQKWNCNIFSHALHKTNNPSPLPTKNKNKQMNIAKHCTICLFFTLSHLYPVPCIKLKQLIPHYISFKLWKLLGWAWGHWWLMTTLSSTAVWRSLRSSVSEGKPGHHRTDRLTEIGEEKESGQSFILRWSVQCVFN